MAKFAFKLDPVLRQRQMIEDQKQRELAQLMRKRMIFHNQLRSIQTELTDSKGQLADGLIGEVDMTRVAQFARFSGQSQVRAQTIVRELAGLESRIVEAQKQLVEAMRQRKALDLLRDKQYKAWKRTQQRREASRLDDLATQAYTRQVVMEVKT
ncbi:MAG TPA: flagellar export protein FliJ [Phycisphaerales bacterium]|nr:flagellar export protein FliJ [Phycisphaerales bacterium]HCD33520.1 flagellar export protein FliJ [Phycisphaerales bacterium]|tara:strand:- start:2000 stop:2461 length:462 start_codon:yes stop_codon:yes gene_type:complete